MALLSYTKTVYINDTAPALDQTNLNNSENGIDTEEHLIEELIQVAAVAVSYVESVWANRKSEK